MAADANTPAEPRREWPIKGNQPAVQRIVTSWRVLTSAGRGPAARTLVACSGGADSTALLLALGTATHELIVAHVMHDLRPRQEAAADRDHVAALADRLGLPFLTREVAVRSLGGNAEATARRLRYGALADLARESGCAWIATGHQANDQFETLVMALVRGAGLDGLRGIAPRRPLAPGIRLIRPMLGVSREEAEQICRDGAAPWRTDRTNLSGENLRSRLRLGPLGQLEQLRPGAAARAAASAAMIREAGVLVRSRAKQVFGDAFEWPRELLRAEAPIVLGQGLRRALLRLSGGASADRIGSKQLRPVVRAIRDSSTEPRRFEWADGVRIHVTAHKVRIGHD